MRKNLCSHGSQLFNLRKNRIYLQYFSSIHKEKPLVFNEIVKSISSLPLIRVKKYFSNRNFLRRAIHIAAYVLQMILRKLMTIIN